MHRVHAKTGVGAFVTCIDVRTQVVWFAGRMGCPRTMASKAESSCTPCLRVEKIRPAHVQADQSALYLAHHSHREDEPEDRSSIA